MDVLTDFNVEFRDGASRQVLVVDDDGRVAYAYLMAADGKISSDVWLYNRCAAPMEPEWTSPENMPFANPVDYVNGDLEFSLPTHPSQLSVEWSMRGGKSFARVFVREGLVAELTDGAKPGWSLLAKKDGPLAKVLEIP
ncbi:hypothetical protein [Duganella sp. Root1480D1]|uniref:hypothetical protein n=1 Tax=Duganella sp. Root1480D1 TaxID=1736471 RepID=UPI0019109FBC|nr:hypothetical protein [Duganella sp. Root1480D1]